tara:strand:- start:312 stop:530 length:219 start_codon:yes stop_codon:yes gene_type:complete
MVKELMPTLFFISLASGEIFNGMNLISVIDNNGSGDTFHYLLIDKEPYDPEDINWLQTEYFHSLIQGEEFRL